MKMEFFRGLMKTILLCGGQGTRLRDVAELVPKRSVCTINAAQKTGYEVKFNTDFNSVIKHCQQSRIDAEGTWITQEFIDVYTQLHEMGIAHSVETYYKGELVGGLYGVEINHIFCGESMFSLRSNASKIALIRLSERLIEKEFQVIDCQITNPHLVSMGAREITREDFLTILHDSSKNKKENLF